MPIFRSRGGHYRRARRGGLLWSGQHHFKLTQRIESEEQVFFRGDEPQIFYVQLDAQMYGNADLRWWTNAALLRFVRANYIGTASLGRRLSFERAIGPQYISNPQVNHRTFLPLAVAAILEPFVDRIIPLFSVSIQAVYQGAANLRFLQGIAFVIELVTAVSVSRSLRFFRSIASVARLAALVSPSVAGLYREIIGVEAKLTPLVKRFLRKLFAIELQTVPLVRQTSAALSKAIAAGAQMVAAVTISGLEHARAIAARFRSVNLVTPVVVNVFTRTLSATSRLTADITKDASLFFLTVRLRTQAGLTGPFSMRDLFASLNVFPHVGRRLGSVIEPTFGFFRKTIAAQARTSTDIVKDATMHFLTALLRTAPNIRPPLSPLTVFGIRIPIPFFRMGSVTVLPFEEGAPHFGTNAYQDSSVGDVAWINPENATSSNDTYATVTLAGETSTWLMVTGFNFEIPPSSEIVGIVPEVEVKSLSGSPTMSTRIIKNGSRGTTNRLITVTGTEAFLQAGNGDTELWDLTWTAADINASDFGLAIRRAAAITNTFSVDSVRISVNVRTPHSGFRWLTTFLGRFGK